MQNHVRHKSQDIDDIVIDLTKSRDAREFPHGESFWEADLLRMTHLVVDHLKQIAPYYASKPKERHPEPCETDRLAHTGRLPTLALAVFGPSGSGKSSFLRTFTSDTRLAGTSEAIRNALKGIPHRFGNVVALPVINPTYFYPDGHLLYAFLAAALQLHDQMHTPWQHEERHEEDFLVLTKVNRAFNDVSKHLQVVDPAAEPKDYDPVGFSMERLQRHSSAHLLKIALQRFIDALVEELCEGTEAAILMPVDDADLSVVKLHPVLHTYRQYLMHPRLIPIFTFTDRFGEEVLREHFRSNVSKDFAIRGVETPGAVGRLPPAEALAVQYLSRVFPVRNRIRLGFAPARAQVACYRVGADSERKKVNELLATASYLLFGHPDRDSPQQVRALLRPATLRRQIQTIDAMYSAGVGPYVCKPIVRVLSLMQDQTDSHDAPSGKCRIWPQVFDAASWALLNVHRDVLRELDLHMEDLYSWARTQLRSFLLQIVLAGEVTRRRSLLDRWRSRDGDRRSQTVSLLAAAVFRPWMHGDPEPAGDEPVKQLEISHGALKGEAPKPAKDHVTAADGVLWFLGLAIGFYLPQMLARNPVRPGVSSDDNLDFLGIGWDLRFGPVSAIRVAETNQHIFPSGMMFVDPQAYARQLCWTRSLEVRAPLTKALDFELPQLEHLLATILQRARLSKSLELIVRSPARFPSACRRLNDLNEQLAASAVLGRFLQGLKDVRADYELVEGALEELSTGEYEQSPPGDEKTESAYKSALEHVKATLETWRTKFDNLYKHQQVKNLLQQAIILSDDELLLRIWSSYGFRGGRFWAGISLWRGLGLIGRILEVYKAWPSKGIELKALKTAFDKHNIEEETLLGPRYYDAYQSIKELKKNGEDSNSESGAIDDDDLIYRALKDLYVVMRNHSVNAMVPRAQLGESEQERQLYLAFRSWRSEELRSAIARMGFRVLRWLLNSVDQQKISVMPDRDDIELKWRRSFMRRLHGDYVLGDLMPQMNSAPLEEQGGPEHKAWNTDHLHWDASMAMRSWIRTLISYWSLCSKEDPGCKRSEIARKDPEGARKKRPKEDKEECNSIARLLWECPFIEPFVNEAGDEDFCRVVQAYCMDQPQIPRCPPYLYFFENAMSARSDTTTSSFATGPRATFPGRSQENADEFRKAAAGREREYQEQVNVYSAEWERGATDEEEEVRGFPPVGRKEVRALRVNSLFREIPRVDWEDFRTVRGDGPEKEPRGNKKAGK